VAWDALAGFLVDLPADIFCCDGDIFYHDAEMGHGVHVARQDDVRARLP
jgi:hypothetical protein